MVLILLTHCLLTRQLRIIMLKSLTLSLFLATSYGALLAEKTSLVSQYIYDTYCETPLMLAAQDGNIKEMKKLISAGANVNAIYGCEQPHAGNPVLRYAIDSRSLEAVALLIAAGANINGATESPIVIHNKSFLPQLHVRNISLLAHAIRIHAPLEIIKTLIESGAHLESHVLSYGWTSLMVAAYVGNIEAVYCLLEAGANRQAVSDAGQTALDYARESNHSAIIALLS